MAQYTEEISLADVKVGDRWVGVTIGPVTVNGDTPSQTLSRVVMTFRLGATTFTLDSDDGDITISDSATWEVEIPAQDSFLPRSGKWQWELVFWRTGVTSPWTLYRGVLVCHDDLD